MLLSTAITQGERNMTDMPNFIGAVVFRKTASSLSTRGTVVKQNSSAGTIGVKFDGSDNVVHLSLISSFCITSPQVRFKNKRFTEYIDQLRKLNPCTICGQHENLLQNGNNSLICKTCAQTLTQCTRCKKYVQFSRKKNGRPLCYSCIKDDYLEKYRGTNDESRLHALGYNVKEKDALPTEIRREILSDIIRLGIMSEYQVRERIKNHYIGYLGRNPNMAHAVLTWKEDLAWLDQTEFPRITFT